jgi:hypothetical protein
VTDCMFMGCDNDEIDGRGPVVLRDGSKHGACTEHWEPIMRVIGQQRTWEQEAYLELTGPPGPPPVRATRKPKVVEDGSSSPTSEV